jgi:hypothetical protein
MDNVEEFFAWLKPESERYWSSLQINPSSYGFQIQPGTKWRPGLSDAQIEQYQSEIGFHFPAGVRAYLRHMNGTDLPTVNVYGSSGTPHAFGPGFYSYPDDLTRIKDILLVVESRQVCKSGGSCRRRNRGLWWGHVGEPAGLSRLCVSRAACPRHVNSPQAAAAVPPPHRN